MVTPAVVGSLMRHSCVTHRFVDLVSQIVIWVAERYSKRLDPRFPVGKVEREPGKVSAHGDHLGGSSGRFCYVMYRSLWAAVLLLLGALDWADALSDWPAPLSLPGLAERDVAVLLL
jgi:hypothetical protein